MVEHHQIIRLYLLDIWRRELKVGRSSLSFHRSCNGQFQPPRDSYPESIIRNILALDDFGLSAQLAIMIEDDLKYKEIIRRRGFGAQALLNLLQAVCYSLRVVLCTPLMQIFNKRLNLAIDSPYRPQNVKALIKLSRASGLYPECLVLKRIDIEGNAVAYGTFGDVYRGRLDGQNVAIKILRVYQTTDRDSLLKV